MPSRTRAWLWMLNSARNYKQTGGFSSIGIVKKTNNAWLRSSDAIVTQQKGTETWGRLWKASKCLTHTEISPGAEWATRTAAMKMLGENVGLYTQLCKGKIKRSKASRWLTEVASYFCGKRVQMTRNEQVLTAERVKISPRPIWNRIKQMSP